MDEKLISRFWEKVDKDGPVVRAELGPCWVWTGAVGGDRYGRLRDGRRCLRSHRLSWELRFGPVPPGFFVCHSCDVRLCVNPDHLFLGTSKNNKDDCVAKERHRRKLTRFDVSTLRAAHSTGTSMQELADKYGVTYCAIWQAIRRITWRHVA